MVLQGLVKSPISRVRGAYVVNSLVGFDIEPAVVSETATRKSDEARPSAVDNCELQITLERCGINRFPFMMDDESTHQANRVCDLNHWGTDCVVNKAMSLANPYRFGITNNEYVGRDFNLLTRYPPRLIAHPTSHGALIAPAILRC